MARIMDEDKTNIVGNTIRKLRLQNNFTQKHLSEELELLAVYVCRGSISRIEDKVRTVTDIELKAFAQVFNVPVNDLFDQK